MPPRLRLLRPHLLSNLSLSQCRDHRRIAFRPFTAVARSYATDAFTAAQKKAHSAASLSRKKWSKTSKDNGVKSKTQDQKDGTPAEEADPVRGITTDYVQSFDSPPSTGRPLLNFRISDAELQSQLEFSKGLGIPVEAGIALDSEVVSERMRERLNLSMERDPNEVERLRKLYAERERREKQEREEELAKYDAQHVKAAEAVQKIMNLDQGSSKDRFRFNVDRCIEEFGRHNTDKTIPAMDGSERPEKFRAGKDTGSSEVQIAILTAKIRTLAGFLETRGRKDKANKRNLRMLVHKRQKLLKYMRRKEKGGPRWRNLVDTLGLTEATWKGEISL